MRMNIVLIGYRGSGKTSIGWELARKLHMPFVDTDQLLMQRARQSIRDIFAAKGEAYFRDLEQQIVAEVAAQDNTVIAAGGGVVLRPANVAALQAQGKVIWLQADPSVLYQRITGDGASGQTRPNLTAHGGLTEVQTLLAQRTPLYQAAAHLTLDVTALSIAQAVEHIQRLL